MEMTWNNMEKKEKLMWIKKAAEDQKRYEVGRTCWLAQWVGWSWGHLPPHKTQKHPFGWAAFLNRGRLGARSPTQSWLCGHEQVPYLPSLSLSHTFVKSG